MQTMYEGGHVMTRHTPGPWNAEGKAICGDGVVVAHTTMRGGQDWLANARLIAAAPDLLEALREILTLTERLAAGTRDETDERIGSARAAIEKAEGGQK
jgi:hypothetical protein